MNLLLIPPHHIDQNNEITISGARAKHIHDVIGAQPGDAITVGVVDGNIGQAEVLSTSVQEARLRIQTLDTPPPPQLPLTLILALPRPRMLHRTLQTVATMGVKHLCLIQSSRVEKSFWQTPLLAEDAVQENLVTGCEQAKATQLPQISFFKRFRPFIEDHLTSISNGHNHKLIAHPGDYPYASKLNEESAVLAIGPEGGFIDKEVATFADAGFEAVQLGGRILRVETAVPVLLAKLYD